MINQSKEANSDTKMEPNLSQEQPNPQITDPEFAIQPVRPSSSYNPITYLQEIKNNEKCTSLSSDTAEYYSLEIINNLRQLLINGKLEIANTSIDIQNYLDKPKITEEEKKLMEEKMKREQIQRQLRYLDVQIHRKKDEEIDFIPQNVFTKEEHQNLMSKFVKERKLIAQKHRQNVQKQMLLEQEEKQKLKKSQDLKKQQQIQKRRLQISKKMQIQKQEHEKLRLMNKQSSERYKEMKNKKSLYDKIQQRYHSQVIMPSLQQKKKKLKEIRELSKNFTIEEIKKHETDYLNRKAQASRTKQQNNEQEWKYQPPPRSQKINQILQNERMEQQKIIQQKKRKIDEKRARIQNFSSYIKEKFIPKVDTAKKQELQVRMNKLNHSRDKQQIDRKILGIRYLQEVRRLKKKKVQDIKAESQRNEKMLHSNDRNRTLTNSGDSSGRHRNYSIQQVKKKQFDRIMNSDSISKEQKIKRLQLQTQKISESFQMKQKILKVEFNDKVNEESVQLLLSSIKAKIGIMDIYNSPQDS